MIIFGDIVRVVGVIVENGGCGAQSAAPIARMVFDYYLLGKVPAGMANEDAGAVEHQEEHVSRVAGRAQRGPLPPLDVDEAAGVRNRI